MDFIYYIPGAGAVGRQEIEAAGLADVLPAGLALAQRATVGGPGGGRPGVLISAGPAATLLYAPARQPWARRADCGGPADSEAWLGLEPADPPTPADLARRELIDGYELPLAGPDGADHPWLIPLARVFPAGTLLPQALALGPGGAVVQEILPRFAAACRLAERLWDLARAAAGDWPADAEPPQALGDAEEFRAAATFLGINYRVGPAEISALGILTTRTLARVVFLAVDLPRYLANRRPAEKDGEVPEAHGSPPVGMDGKKNGATGNSGAPA